MYPIVSIVIPVYNNPLLLKTMVDSILEQNYCNWELLLVDDGSDIETIDLIKSFCKKDNRILLFKRERLPKGAPTCRNLGFEQAKGKYIIFFDSDDYVAPYCISQRVEFMEANADLDYAIFPAATFNKRIGDGKIAYGVPNNCRKDDLYYFLMPRLPFVVWNNIYRKDSLLMHKIYWDEHLKSLQDSDYNIECFIAGLKYKYAGKHVSPDYYYRLSTNASIAKNIISIAHLSSHLYLYKKMINGVKKHFGNKYDRILKNRSITFFMLMIKVGTDSTPYINELFKIISIFPGYKFLVFQFNLYRFFYQKCRFNMKVLKFLIFPHLITYAFYKYIKFH